MTFVVFILALVLFNIFSNKVILTDVTQYLGSAKGVAEISISKFRTQTLGYGWFMGQSLKLFPSLLTAKLFNAMFLFLTGLVLYKINKKALYLWTFSPVVWYMAGWISPILPVTFFLTLAYYLFERNRILSALCLGIVSVLWGGGLYVAFFFLLVFFYDKSFEEFLRYVFPFLIAFSIRGVIDLYYYGIPFISILRELGSNLIYFLPNSAATSLPQRSIWLYLSLIVIISPLLFKLYKVDFRKYKKELIFIGCMLVFFIINFQLRLFLVLAPLLLVMLARKLTKKEILFGVILSIPFILLFSYPYFGVGDDMIINDLEKLSSEFPDESFIVGSEDVSEEQIQILECLYWGSEIKEFIWYSEYKLWLEDSSVFREYEISSNSRIDNLRKLVLNLKYERTDLRDYSDVNYLVLVGPEGDAPEGFEFVKEYEVLRVFEKQKL